MKARSEPVFRSSMEVAELEVRTDKAGILGLMTGDWKFTVLRLWHGTARGGLKLQGGA
ncbi:hypothetical protein LP414_27660 [Polaromonas sp. P1(28)-13]|nr:hypothetical protein LP414_27660 [Polaromonas sp. P1(28)-13]